MPNFGLMSGNPYYTGPSGLAAGVNAFAEGLMKAYGMFSGVRQRDEEIAMQKKLLQMKLDEEMRKRQAGEEISGLLQPQYQPYFNAPTQNVNGQWETAGATRADNLTPLGKQKLQGLMQNVPAQVYDQASRLSIEDPKDVAMVSNVDNPGYAPAQQAALTQMQQAGGEMVRPKLDMQNLIGILAKTDPDKAAALQVSLQNTEAKAEMQKYLSDIRYEYLKNLYASKTEQDKELAKMKYENGLELLREKYEYMKELKKMPSISIHTGGGKEDDGSKDQIKLNRAQSMAKRDLGMKYTLDSLTGIYLDRTNSPVSREKINAEYQSLVQKYYGGQGKLNVNQNDPLGIRK